MTTTKDLIRDFGKKVKAMVEEDGYDEDEFEDSLDDLMEELKKFYE